MHNTRRPLIVCSISVLPLGTSNRTLCRGRRRPWFCRLGALTSFFVSFSCSIVASSFAKLKLSRLGPFRLRGCRRIGFHARRRGGFPSSQPGKATVHENISAMQSRQIGFGVEGKQFHWSFFRTREKRLTSCALGALRRGDKKDQGDTRTGQTRCEGRRFRKWSWLELDEECSFVLHHRSGKHPM